MSVNRARRRRGPADVEKGLPLEVNDQAVRVTGEVEQPDAGAAVEVAEPDIEPVLAGVAVPPVSETEASPLTAGSAVPDVPEASPSSDGPAAATVQPADGSPASAVSTPSAAVRSVPPGSAGARTDARLAHVHLAVGMFGLARAELETLAGRGSLDVPALADLAEVRWRTGDLVGAGEAADAHLEAGGEELIALCVAAEAAAAGGRAADARNLAARVLARGRDRLDDLFAGQPRGAIWPAGAGAVAPMAESAAAQARRAADIVPPQAAPGMPGDLAEVQARLDAGELVGIATRLALLLRTRPALAAAVLAVADDAIQAAPLSQEVAALHLVRGDAYRLMGRESLATEAFQQSSRSLQSRPPEETL